MRAISLFVLSLVVLLACSKSSKPDDIVPEPLHNPVIIYAIQTDNNQIVICLDHVYDDSTEYLFEKKTDAEFYPIYPIQLTSYTFADSVSVVENDYSITYRLRVKQADTYSEYSNNYTCNYHSDLIFAPSFLSVRQQEMNKLKISWQNNSSTATTLVLEKSKNGSSFAAFQTMPSYVTSVFDIIPETGDYAYRIKAVRENLSSEYSNTVTYEVTSIFPTAGLIAYYPFNGNANDASGGRHHGTVYGPVLTTDRFGNPNQAYDFDGVDDYIEIPATGDLVPEFSYITLSGWFNARDWFDFPGYGGWGALMHHGFSTSSPFCFQVKGYPGEYSSNVGIYFGNSFRSYYDQSVFQLHQWYHVAVVLAPYSIQFYVNGALTHVENYYLSLPASSEPYYIGKDPPEATLDYHIGKLDDLCIFNRSLNAAEIQSLYLYGGWSPSR